MFGLLHWLRKRRAARKPFPPEWRDVLRRHVPFYERLGEARPRFEDALKLFALTKNFEGAGGFEVDDAARVIIAATAARLSLNLSGDPYRRLRDIVVYPRHYRHPAGAVIFGEAHTHGTVVLSYEAVLAGLRNPEDGHDTAMHELAHVLDIADGQFDGTPILERFAAYAPWATVMTEHYLSLREGGRHVLREYGATNEAEFFAVATEAFFEKPRRMKKRCPALYELLAEYYRRDPLDEDGPEASVQTATAGGAASRQAR